MPAPEVSVSLVFKRGAPSDPDCFIYEVCWPNGAVWRYELNPYNAIVVSKAYRAHKSKLKFANALKTKADRSTIVKKSPGGEVGGGRGENPDEPVLRLSVSELFRVIDDSSNPIIVQFDDIEVKTSISKLSQTVTYLKRKKPQDRQAIMQSVTKELEKTYNLNTLTKKEVENAKYDIVILYANEIIEGRVEAPPFLNV